MREMRKLNCDWIKEIPSSWKMRKLKNISNIYVGNSIKDEEKNKYEDSENAIPYIATKEIDGDTSKVNYLNGMYTKINDIKFRVAKKGSTLMCIEGGSAGKKITLLEQDVSFVNKLCCFEANNINNEYLYYFLKSPAFKIKFDSHISGLIGGVSQNELKEFPICIPPIYEQEKIARFLNKKVLEIDNIIEKTKETIEDYKKYKKTLIKEVVTCGLHKNVKKKKSGIEWCENIPYNWQVMPNKYIMKKKKEIISKYNNENVMSLSINGVTVRDLDAGGKMPSSFDEYQKITKDNLLMCLFDYDVTPRCIGLIQQDGITSPAYSQFILLNNNFPKYYYYYYLMIDNTKELLHLAKNLRHSFTEEQLGELKTPVPPIDEQKEIALYLDKEINKIDELIENKQKIIEELEQYKKSLIYEYVTGKKEVI